MSFDSGILDRARLVSNILMVILVAGNIFFSIQYTEGLKKQNTAQTDNTVVRIQSSRLLKLFVDVVLNTENKQITYDDRVALENDVRQMKDTEVIKQWDSFVASKDPKTAQQNAISLMKLLTNKLLVN